MYSGSKHLCELIPFKHGYLMSRPQIDATKVSMVTVDDGNDGQRVDNFLIYLLKGAPKTLVYRIIRKGEVRVNKGRVKADTRIKSGDIVRVPPVRLPDAAEVPDVSPALQGILDNSILYEDDGLIAVNKPHGLAVHGGSGVSLGLIEALRKLRPNHEFLELVHRLDRDTSGVILVAKKRKVLTVLQKMLVDKKGIRKRYLALVHGRWDKATTDIRLPLLRTERKSGERIVVVSEEGKSCHTKTRLLASAGRYSLIEAEPVTGRTHQIRVHTLSQGHIIAGDEKYSDRIDALADKESGIRRLCLHAWRLSFTNPLNGEKLHLEATPDKELRNIFRNAGCEVDLSSKYLTESPSKGITK
jgi:23S rRNA pseudouridine955/2504/2580 synthase